MISGLILLSLLSIFSKDFSTKNRIIICFRSWSFKLILIIVFLVKVSESGMFFPKKVFYTLPCSSFLPPVKIDTPSVSQLRLYRWISCFRSLTYPIIWSEMVLDGWLRPFFTSSLTLCRLCIYVSLLLLDFRICASIIYQAIQQ